MNLIAKDFTYLNKDIEYMQKEIASQPLEEINIEIDSNK